MPADLGAQPHAARLLGREQRQVGLDPAGKKVRDSDAVARPLDDLDVVARAERAGREHTQVRTGQAGAGEALDPALLAEPLLEGHARRPGRRHLADDRVRTRTDPPALADLGTADVDSRGPQVLAEEPGRDVALQLGRPPVGVLVGIGVQRLLGAAVVRPVDLGVQEQPLRADLEPARPGPLVDGGDVGGLARVGDDRVDDADGAEPAVPALLLARVRSGRERHGGHPPIPPSRQVG
jgi:hypothetical protein